jgi:hypothetical protein
MSGAFLGLIIESLVAVLLVLAIGYCMLLNQRIKRLRGDEAILRATIAELLAATETAQRAIAHLRTTVQDSDRSLGERLQNAERLSGEIGRQLERGEDVIGKIARIAGAADRGGGAGEIARPARESARAERTVAAAQAIAIRTRIGAERAA